MDLRGSWRGSSRVDCKKMQFFCKKMQIYLHISKKMRTFVADFNSEVHNISNLFTIMEKKCVFKCCINGKWYRVYECVHPDDHRRNFYQTFIGRKRLDFNIWSCLGSAIGSILTSVDRGIMNDLISFWK